MSNHTTVSLALEDLRARLGHVLTTSPQLPDGLQTMMVGLDELLTHVQAHTHDDAQLVQYDLLAQGIHGVLDVFAPRRLEITEVEDERDDTPAVPQGLEQFIDGFRRESQKRLTGLSISMMGLFNADADERAIDTSATHLHTIRGGAAMLNLKHIAQIAGLMEQLLLSMRRVPTTERTWPAQSLMRGFRALQQAMDDHHASMDEALARSVVMELRECFDTVEDDFVLEEISRASSRRSTELLAVERFSKESKTRLITPMDVPLEQRILIVDDQETIAASVGFVLSDLDVPLDIAHHGEQALNMLNERPYSLVISDVAMPRMDGIALTRIIRNSSEHRDIPIILLTSLDHPDERDAGVDAGANDYIIKGSIGGGELAFRVQELLRMAPFVPIQVSAQAAPQTARPHVLVAEDAEAVAASIAFILSTAQLDITLAHDGMDALKRLERERFDLLISDWQMPNMSGVELAQAVRASTLVAPLPIILLTSKSDDESRRLADEAGVDAFLVKGDVASDTLIAQVMSLLEAHSTP